MAKLVILITSRLDEGQRLGEAWREAGAPGVTFIEGYGLSRLQQASDNHAEILPGMLSLLEILRQNQETSLVILSLVDDDHLANKLIALTEQMLGDLRQPNNGIAFMIQVDHIIGLQDHKPK